MPDTAKVAAAFVKAQSVMGVAKMGSVNPHFKSKYAAFPDVMEAVRKPLLDNGIAVMQSVEGLENGGITLATILLHESGESLVSRVWVPVAGNAQQAGSSLTYARRYGLAAACGIVADEDDDGNAAVTPVKKAEPKAKRPEKGVMLLGQHKGKPLSEVPTEALEKAIVHIQLNEPEKYAAHLDELTLALDARRTE